MNEDLAFSDDERGIEISSIAAIYPELTIEPGSKFKASLNIPVTPNTPLQADFSSSFHPSATSLPTPPTSVAHDDVETCGGDENDTKEEQETVEIRSLSNLPPLKLDIELPDGYPATTPPAFDITTHPSWLSEQTVCNLLVDGVNLWEETRDMMVYSYIDHLQQRAEDAFGLLQRPGKAVPFKKEMEIALLDFDRRAKQHRFEQETFVCGICLEPKKGTQCHRLLLCSHVFCVKCLQDFFNSCIREGDVSSVKCAAPGCGKETAADGATESGRPRNWRKEDRTLTPSELLQIPLDQEVVHRYAFLKRKNKLESDKNTIYCPRKWCQGAAKSKKHPKPEDLIRDYAEMSGGEEDVTHIPEPAGEENQLPAKRDRVGVCEDCGYAFCRVCKRGWHGELVNCVPRSQAELTAEEKATVDFLEIYTTPCPSCDTRCQKTHGCNHMICFKCGTHFCYLCSSWLCPSQPYQHFNNIKRPCYMRLWEGESADNAHGAIDPFDASDDEF